MRQIEGNRIGAEGCIGSDECHEQDMMCPPSILIVRPRCWQRAYERRHMKTTLPTLFPSSYCISLPQEWGGPLCFKGAIPKILPASSLFPKHVMDNTPAELISTASLICFHEGQEISLCILTYLDIPSFWEKKGQVAILLCSWILSAWSPWQSGTQGQWAVIYFIRH